MIEPEQEASEVRKTLRVVVLAARGVSYLVYAYVLVVEIILGLGFFLLLFGANRSAGFTEWVYRSLDRAMEPFRGIFTPIELGTTAGNDVSSVFETSVVFAMVIYGLVAIAVRALVSWLTYRLKRLDADAADVARTETHVEASAGTLVQASAGKPTGGAGAP